MTDPGTPTPLLRVCDLCGGVDPDPRHVIAGAVRDAFPRVADNIVDKVLAAAPDAHKGRLLRELLDTAASDRHLQCCRDAGCPNGTCDLVLQDVDDEVIGDELRAHLTENSDAIADRVNGDRQRRLEDEAIRTELLGGN